MRTDAEAVFHSGEIMTKVNTADARTQSPIGQESVESGGTAHVRSRNVPNADIRPGPGLPAQPRPVGIDRGMIIPADFFEPLADELLDEFEGPREPA